MKTLYKLGLASFLFIVIVILVLPPIWKTFYFREGTVAVKYCIIDEDFNLHYIITIYNKDYEKPGSDLFSQDFKQLDYEVSFKMYDSVNRLDKVTIPARFKLARLEQLVSPE